MFHQHWIVIKFQKNNENVFALNEREIHKSSILSLVISRGCKWRLFFARYRHVNSVRSNKREALRNESILLQLNHECVRNELREQLRGESRRSPRRRQGSPIDAPGVCVPHGFAHRRLGQPRRRAMTPFSRFFQNYSGRKWENRVKLSEIKSKKWSKFELTSSNF